MKRSTHDCHLPCGTLLIFSYLGNREDGIAIDGKAF